MGVGSCSSRTSCAILACNSIARAASPWPESPQGERGHVPASRNAAQAPRYALEGTMQCNGDALVGTSTSMMSLLAICANATLRAHAGDIAHASWNERRVSALSLRCLSDTSIGGSQKVTQRRLTIASNNLTKSCCCLRGNQSRPAPGGVWLLKTWSASIAAPNCTRRPRQQSGTWIS